MRIIILVVSLFSSLVVQADLKDKIDKIIRNSGLNRSDLGIEVVDEAKHELFALNAQKHFVPASITKLMTSAAILFEMQPTYQFHTQIYVDGEQSGNLLKGNLYLKGGGDPTFVSEKMWVLVDHFLRTGIKKVSGQIIVDDSYFDEERFDSGRESDHTERAYDAPTGALSFDWNSSTFWVRPGQNVGDKPVAFLVPENELVSGENRAKTSSSGVELAVDRKTDGDHDTLVLNGKIAVGTEEKHVYGNISSPPLFAGANFKGFLRQRNVEVNGKISRGNVPSFAKLVVDETSESLGQIIQGMNKFSNNFIAEMLAKNLAVYKYGPPGEMRKGLDQIRKVLSEDVGLDGKSFSLTNVSGFTRKNSFQPSQFIHLLHWVSKQFRIFPEFIQSLPVAGVDGTLKDRMKGTPAEGRVRAKTGFLSGVVALSGYADQGGNRAIFCFMYNGGADPAKVRRTFDEMAISLVR